MLDDDLAEALSHCVCSLAPARGSDHLLMHRLIGFLLVLPIAAYYLRALRINLPGICLRTYWPILPATIGRPQRLAENWQRAKQRSGGPESDQNPFPGNTHALAHLTKLRSLCYFYFSHIVGSMDGQRTTARTSAPPCPCPPSTSTPQCGPSRPACHCVQDGEFYCLISTTP